MLKNLTSLDTIGERRTDSGLYRRSERTDLGRPVPTSIGRRRLDFDFANHRHQIGKFVRYVHLAGCPHHFGPRHLPAKAFGVPGDESPTS